jgi:hypothetical protein
MNTWRNCNRSALESITFPAIVANTLHSVIFFDTPCVLATHLAAEIVMTFGATAFVRASTSAFVVTE